MNIYQKLQKIRVELQNCKFKKSGKNDFAKYTYYELGDFLPKINELMLENGMTSTVNFNGHATLTLINTEKPEETISFESPVAEANLKGCHPVQNLGAVQTYLRRYLYTNAFEIVENDALEALTGKPDKPLAPQQQKQQGELTEAQIKRLFAIVQKSGKTNEEVKKIMKDKYNKDSSKLLNRKEYDELCNILGG
jgi:hypothetical protein